MALSLDYQDMITVLVGKNKAASWCTGTNICNKSAFFKAACEQEWQGDEEFIVPLESIDEDTFAPYEHWVYNDNIKPVLVNTHIGHEAFVADLLAKLYVAGDVLLDTHVKNSTMHRLLLHFGICKTKIWWSTIDFVWNNIADDCPLRLCILDHFILVHGKEYLDEKPDLHTNGFLLDLCKRKMEWTPTYRSQLLAKHGCKVEYHVRLDSAWRHNATQLDSRVKTREPGANRHRY